MSCTAPCLGAEIVDQTSFGNIRDEWERLLLRSYENRIFATPGWHALWWEHFGVGQASILLARDQDRQLKAVLPLHVVGVTGSRILTLLGDHNVADYMDGVAEKAGALDLLSRLWHCALRELPWDEVVLRHVPSSSPLVPALRNGATGLGLSMAVEQDDVCPVALLCSNWDAYLQMLTKKQRHEIRRKIRRSQEDVEWSWRTAATQEDVERDLPVFFRLHEASARDKAGFFTPEMRRYFLALSCTLLDAGILKLSVFRREGLDVAATMGFLHRDRYLLYNSGYDPAYAGHSPGIAAVALAMQDAITAKAVAFDFLSGDEPYKYQFGATNTVTCRVRVTK